MLSKTIIYLGCIALFLLFLGSASSASAQIAPNPVSGEKNISDGEQLIPNSIGFQEELKRIEQYNAYINDYNSLSMERKTTRSAIAQWTSFAVLTGVGGVALVANDPLFSEGDLGWQLPVGGILLGCSYGVFSSLGGFRTPNAKQRQIALLRSAQRLYPVYLN